MTDEASNQDQIDSLRAMLEWPDKQHIRDIIKRRIFALEFEIVFTNPFNPIDEALYLCWR